MPPSPRHISPRSAPPLVCLACHGQRLATLLETASLLRLFRPAGEAFAEEAAWPMPEGGLPALAVLLSRLDVRLLVCGGATCCCLAPFARLGLAVAPWIAGDVPTVLAALRADRLETLLAPGARPESAHRRCRGFHAIPPENDPS